jgi:hypothetical protein
MEGAFQTASKVSETLKFAAVRPTIREYSFFLSCGSSFLDERLEQTCYLMKKTVFFLSRIFG